MLNLNKHDLDESYDSPPIPDKIRTNVDLANAGADRVLSSPTGTAGSGSSVDEYSDSSAARAGSSASRWPMDDEDSY